MLRSISCQQRGSKNAVKRKESYICLACDAQYTSLCLICEKCHATDTVIPLDEDELSEMAEESSPRKRAKRATEISTVMPPLISTGRKAWDLVLGGGVARPSSILVAGPSGVGKTSTLLAILASLGKAARRPVLYGSAEMPEEMMATFLNRLNLDRKYLFINTSKQAEDMHDDILELSPVAIVWDSIQRFRVNGSLGEVELRDVVTGAIESGERVKATSFLISHVTKDENFMGPNGIGHDVDVIIHLRKVGENVVSVETREKNRHAPTPLTATEYLV
jgi:predicted ATP-dependent serine protease